MSVSFRLDGASVTVRDDESSLLDVLREELGCRSVKDGCSPQGQCGCCTVLVDGAPRVSCVTAVRRVRDRDVTTVDGLPPALRDRLVDAFVATGASQCGFCTPGILVRLASLAGRKDHVDDAVVRTALAAHLCRCTGWQTIVEAALDALDEEGSDRVERDPLLSAWRAEIEGRGIQASDGATVLGRAGFADDTHPAGALVALPGPDDDPVVAPTLREARAVAQKVQGRRSGMALVPPLQLAPGEWDLALSTTWVEPAYLEPDASWCTPGAEPASPLANGGAFGGKRTSVLPDTARALAADHNCAVRALWPREEVVRRGPKRPPVAVGVRSDGTGVFRAARTPRSVGLEGYAARVATVAPGLAFEWVDLPGPPVCGHLRGAGWAEAAVVMAALGARLAGADRPDCPVEVVGPDGGWATVSLAPDGGVTVRVAAGDPLDPVTLRSYCIGAVHQALGWVWSEGIAVDHDGTVHDLTIRSFGILPARDMPPVTVEVEPSDHWPVNGSDAVFAAAAAAAWLSAGLPPAWPVRRAGRRAPAPDGST